MTDNKSPGDRLLELMVFGPTGLAVTLVEEFPKFVEKGRHRVEGQVHTARLVGQFAFQMGRRQLEHSLGQWGGHTDTRARHADGHGAGEHPEGHAPAPAPRAEATSVPAPPGRDAPEAKSEPPTPWRPSVWLEGGGPNGTGSPSSLAIPGYDSLSASQVVQRLEGLSPPELEEVRAHEAAHRQRRTILHRVEQLLTGGDDVQP